MGTRWAARPTGQRYACLVDSNTTLPPRNAYARSLFPVSLSVRRAETVHSESAQGEYHTQIAGIKWATSGTRDLNLKHVALSRYWVGACASYTASSGLPCPRRLEPGHCPICPGSFQAQQRKRRKKNAARAHADASGQTVQAPTPPRRLRPANATRPPQMPTIDGQMGRA
jgi:hypothetical protein